MATVGSLDRGREAFAQRVWGQAHALLASVDRDGGLEPEDLELLAQAAYLTGRDGERNDALERTHNAFAARGDRAPAARCAFWMGLGLVQRGEVALGGGWLARAHRLVADEPDCVEQGYLLVPEGLRAIEHGDPTGAHAKFGEAARAGERFADPDLTALGRLGQAQSEILQGHAVVGLALLDEVMVAVHAGEVSAIPAGIIYCAAIELCHATFDVCRGQAWTAALSIWCADQPDLIPFRGQCLVHRAELMVLHGAWPDAMQEAKRAGEQLAAPPGQPAAGAAFYQQAELHRLRGEFTEAEDAYRRAVRWGHTAQPGLSRLRLAQGQVEAAAGAIRRVLDETRSPPARAELLPTCAEVALATDDVAAARVAADELADVAAGMDAPLLRAIAAHVTGAVLLVEGHARDALVALREAVTGWARLGAPYEAARVRVLVGMACRELGDPDGAAMELAAARSAFAELGARPEVDRLDQLALTAAAPPAGGLTAREVQILRLVAAGRSNREVAAELVISEHTVARHLQNIFTKLGVGSRTAAAAYAHRHDLL